MELINGDALQELDKLIEQGVKVDAIITDPPYGVNFKAHYDDSKQYVFSQIDMWYKQFYSLLNDKAHMFVFVPIKEIHRWIESGIKAGFDFKNIISTIAHTTGSSTNKNGFDYSFQPILHFTKNGARNFEEYDFIPTSDARLKDKRNKNPKPFKYIYPNHILKEITFCNTRATSKHNINTGRHPNEKNIELLMFLVGISTKEDETVLDPFMGSGTTGVAAKQLNRQFIGIELDDKYFEIAKERLEDE